MALTNCKECKKEVAKSAKVCPNCGINSPGTGSHNVLMVVFITIFTFYMTYKCTSQINNEKALPSSENSSQEKEKNTVAEQIATRTINTIPKKSSWESIEITEANNHSYSLTIWYKQSPHGYAEVEADTKAVARALLKELVDAGINPAKEMVIVLVFGEMHTQGETGTRLVQNFGNTSYSPTRDQLTFEASRK